MLDSITAVMKQLGCVHSKVDPLDWYLVLQAVKTILLILAMLIISHLLRYK